MILRALIALCIMSALARYLILSVASLSLGAFLYMKGRTDCYVKQVKIQAEQTERWAERTSQAAQSAAERAVASERARMDNEKTAEEIADAAKNEEGSDELCVSADTVERLRNLR